MIPHNDAVILCNRAWAIVERLYPDIPTPHGFYQREAFVEACKYRAARDSLYKRIFARLAEKAAAKEPLAEPVQGDPMLWRRVA